MLTAWVPAERSARFYGHYVRQNGETQTEPQKLLSSVSHISLTPFHGGVANRQNTATLPSRNREGFYFIMARRFLSIFVLCKQTLHPGGEPVQAVLDAGGGEGLAGGVGGFQQGEPGREVEGLVHVQGGDQLPGHGVAA